MAFSMQMKRVAFGTVLVTLLAAGSVAEARELTYAAPPGCPTRDTVAARLDATGRPAVMTIDRIGDAYAGVVTLGDGATATSRSVRAQSCGAVVDALSLVVALDAEPPAAKSPPAPAHPDEAPVPAPAPASASPTPVDAADPLPAGASSSPASRRLDLYAGVLATGTGYPSYGSLIGASLFFDVGLTGPSWWQPSARVLASRTLSQREALVSQSYSFQLTTGALEACPLGIGTKTGALRLSTCVRGELGALEVTPFEGEGATRAWAAAGGVLRGRLVFATIDGTRLAIDAGGGLLNMLTHDRFLGSAPPSLDVTKSAFTVVAPESSTAWEASLGIGAIFP
jgi:hypothetical protein